MSHIHPLGTHSLSQFRRALTSYSTYCGRPAKRNNKSYIFPAQKSNNFQKWGLSPKSERDSSECMCVIGIYFGWFNFACRYFNKVRSQFFESVPRNMFRNNVNRIEIIVFLISVIYEYVNSKLISSIQSDILDSQ